MFDERNPQHPMQDDKIPSAVTDALKGIVGAISELPFRELRPGDAVRIAERIRAATGLPLVSCELHPYRSIPFVINALRYRADKVGLEKLLAPHCLSSDLGPKPGTQIGEYEILGFFGHAGLSALYQAKEKGSSEVVLAAVPLSTSSPARLSERVPRGFYSHVPEGGVTSVVACRSSADAYVQVYAGTIATVTELERLRYQGDCKVISAFSIGERWGHSTALIFRTGPVYSLRHHLQLQIGYSLGVFSQLAAWCQNIGGHGNLSPESIMLADGALKALINPSVKLFDGHFFTSNWEYNPLRREGAAADVFAIGVMLYENFTGKRPFEAPFVARMGEEEREFELSTFMSFHKPSVFSPLLKPEMERIIIRALRDSSYKLPELAADLATYAASFGQDTKSH